jgi:hypothetical protein
MHRRALCALILALVWAVPAGAQSGSGAAPHLRDQITKLFEFGTCDTLLCLDGSVNSANGHGDHFLPAAGEDNLAVINFVNEAIGSNASNFPLSATSSGVSFKLVGGIPVKSAISSGPIFGERAQTLGKGRFLMGGNLSGIRFKTLRGVPIDNLTLNFTHENVTGFVPGDSLYGNPTYENDLIQVRMAMYVDVNVASFFMTYGLFDKVDLSVAVPLVNTSFRGRSTAQVIPFAYPTPHFFGGTQANPILRAATATFGSATGIGDVAGRIKINLANGDRFAFALLGDVRLPTGNEKDLLGAGSTSVRGVAIASARFGQFSPHFNAGYLSRGGSSSNDALLGTVGFDQALSDWATLAADVLSEWQVGANKLILPGPVTYQAPVARTVDRTQIPDRRDNRALASLGFKFRAGAATIVTNALIPVLKGALEPNVVWTTGLEFNF